jgi:hypothetical protein
MAVGSAGLTAPEAAITIAPFLDSGPARPVRRPVPILSEYASAGS